MLMNAAVCESYGDPEVLQLKQVTRPEIAADEILVKNFAAPVTAADYRIRGLIAPKGFRFITRLAMGFSKPRKSILGLNFAGQVVAVGDKVTKFRPGDRVFGSTEFAFGTYADFVKIPEGNQVALIPDNLDYDQAAAIPFGAFSAHYFLIGQGKVRAGEDVLVVGASGAVGSAVVQMAKHLGAKVTAVCSGRNTQWVKDLGADQVIDYTQQDVSALTQKFDMIVECVSGLTWKRGKPLLKDNGGMIMIDGGWPGIGWTLATKFSSKRVIGGVASEKHGVLDTIANWYQAGILRPVIDRHYTLDEIQQAHRYAQSRRKRGNIVLTLNGYRGDPQHCLD